ncbi:MAG TPA: glycosyltransferase family 4 protein [bacterium]|nr:glycosyltransferase family 4 protein [bacterium]
MKILFLTDNFPPETNAPALRTFEHARVWAEDGHRVTVITGAPNFPTGRVHDGYRNRPYSVEEMDGVRVVRVWTYVAPNMGRFRRSFDYLSFMLSSFPAALIQERPDVVIGTSPQLLTTVSAWAAARIRRVPFVFELRDLWPESISAVEAVSNERVLRAIARLANFLYHRADMIVSVTESFVEILQARGIPESRLAVIRNGVNLSEFTPGPRDNGFRAEAGIDADDFVATYVGTLGMAHGLASVIETAELTRDEPIHYVFVGEGAERAGLESEVERRGLRNVTFLGGQPRERIPLILNASDVVLVHLKDDPLFDTVIPSKIFEAMAVAKPLIHAVKGESARIVTNAGAGVISNPESPEDLAGAIRGLLSDPGRALEMGRRGRAAAEGEFCRRAAARKMLGVLQSVAGRK